MIEQYKNKENVREDLWNAINELDTLIYKMKKITSDIIDKYMEPGGYVVCYEKNQKEREDKTR